MSTYLIGLRPTSDKLHIGHYFSIIKPVFDILSENKENKIIFLIANLHSFFDLRKYSNKVEYLKSIYNNIYSLKDELNKIFKKYSNNVVIRVQENYNIDDLMTIFLLLLSVAKGDFVFNNKIIKTTLSSDLFYYIENNYNKEILNIFYKILKDYEFILYGNISDNFVNKIIKEYDLYNYMKEIQSIFKMINNQRGIIGFMTYSILMASDIILHNPDYVIIGKDQIVNYYIYYELAKFLERNSLLPVKKIANVYMKYDNVICGNDGKKMSKSSNNCLYINDCTSLEVIESFLLQSINYPRRKNEPGDYLQCPISSYLKCLGDTYMESLCTSGLVLCKDCKKYVAELLYKDIQVTFKIL